METFERAVVGFGSEEAFRNQFWEDAVFAEVGGRHGRDYELRPFRFGRSGETLVVPPELANFVTSRIAK
jgi:hypothetical protein